mgnify:CR=1 FL=1
MKSMESRDQLVRRLADEAIKMDLFDVNEIEKYCWMVLHKYHHEVFPTEYDIRGIDESLYLEVLAYIKTIR